MTSCGTRFYMGPEMLSFPPRPHTAATDLYSFGFTLAALLGTQYPYRPEDDSSHIDFRHRVLGFAADGVTPVFCCAPGVPEGYACDCGAHWEGRFALVGLGARELVLGLCHPQPEQRWSLERALRHPWWGRHGLGEDGVELGRIREAVRLTNEKRARAEAGMSVD